MRQNETTTPQVDLINDYQGYGLGIFTDENATGDEFIIYMEEVTIPERGAFDIHLLRDDGTRRFIGSALPDICCGHAGEDEDNDEDEDPHEGRLIFNHVSPDSSNLFAQYSGVTIMLADEVIFQDIMPPQSLPYLRALLVEDATQGYPGYAPALKRDGKRLLEMATEAVESGELEAVQETAKAMYSLLLDGHTGIGLYQTFQHTLTQAERAAHMPSTKPALIQRLKQIQGLYETIEPQILQMIMQTWFTAFYTRTPGRARREAQYILDMAEAIYRDIKQLYKTSQQMSWLAPARI